MIDRAITAAITIVLWEYRYEILAMIHSLLKMV